jgi:ATP-binding cassette subfamily B protein
MFDMRMQIYRHLQRLDPPLLRSQPRRPLMTRVTTDVDVINDLFTSGVVSIFGDVFTLAGIMIVMLTMNWKLALGRLRVLPLIVVITQWFRRNVRESYRTVRRLIARINAYLQEHITGMPTVQLFRGEARAYRALRRDQRGTPCRQRRFDLYYAVFYPAIEIVGALASALTIWYGGQSVLAGTLTLGSLVAFLDVLAAVLPPDLRHVGEVQHPPGGDGFVGADFQTPG